MHRAKYTSSCQARQHGAMNESALGNIFRRETAANPVLNTYDRLYKILRHIRTSHI